MTRPLDPAKVSVSFVPGSELSDASPLLLLSKGEPQYLDERRAKEVLSEEDINIFVDVGMGKETATYWTCDLSHVCIPWKRRIYELTIPLQEYVTINGDYRS